MEPHPDHAELEGALARSLMEQRHLGVGACGSDGVLVLMSPALEACLGTTYSPTAEPAWAGHYWLCDAQGRPLPSGADPLARAHRGEQVTDQLVSVRRPDRPVRWLVCSGFPLHDRDGRRIGAAVFVLDVTARAAEQSRLDELRDRLVETVNHEVRTPLATITGHLELLEDVVSTLPDRARWSIEAIGRGAGRLGEVVATISELTDAYQAPGDGVSRS